MPSTPNLRGRVVPAPGAARLIPARVVAARLVPACLVPVRLVAARLIAALLVPAVAARLVAALLVPAIGAATGAAPPALAAAEPSRAAHGHPAATRPSAPPAPVPLPAGAPAAPPGPLDAPAALVPHGEKSLIEAVTRAGQRLVAVGVGGLILLSDDGGLSWRQVRPPVAATLTGVWFVDDGVGWAIGHYGVVLRTEDAGESWTLALDGPRAAQITLDAALSSNGSDTARQKAIESARRLAETDPSRPFLLMQADGADILRVIGAGGLALETEDAGRHWHPWSNAIDDPDALPLLGMAERDGVMLVDGARGLLLAGRPEDGLPRLHPPTDATLFGALDAGRFGFLLFGQQGNVFVGTLAQPAVATRAQAWRQVDTPTQNSFTAALLRRDGGVLLGDSAGMVWSLAGKPDEPRLDPAPPRAPFPILGMVDAPDGALVLAGAGGLLRIEPPASPSAPTSASPSPTSPSPASPAASAPPAASTPGTPDGGKAAPAAHPPADRTPG